MNIYHIKASILKMCNLGKFTTFANAEIMLICGNYLQVIFNQRKKITFDK